MTVKSVILDYLIIHFHVEFSCSPDRKQFNKILVCGCVYYVFECEAYLAIFLIAKKFTLIIIKPIYYTNVK